MRPLASLVDGGAARPRRGAGAVAHVPAPDAVVAGAISLLAIVAVWQVASTRWVPSTFTRKVSRHVSILCVSTVSSG